MNKNCLNIITWLKYIYFSSFWNYTDELLCNMVIYLQKYSRARHKSVLHEFIVWFIWILHLLLSSHIDGFLQECSISTANAQEILQSCTKLSICNLVFNTPNYKDFCSSDYHTIQQCFISWWLINSYYMYLVLTTSEYQQVQGCFRFYNCLGAVSIRKTVLPGMTIPMLKIRRPNGRLIFNMGIPIPGKDGLYIETGPWFQVQPMFKLSRHRMTLCESFFPNGNISTKIQVMAYCRIGRTPVPRLNQWWLNNWCMYISVTSS